MDDDSDYHKFHRKGIPVRLREGDNDPLHKEIDGDAVQRAVEKRMVNQEWHDATGKEEDRGCSERDNKVQKEAEGGSTYAPTERTWAEDARGNALQETERLDARRYSIDDQSGGYVHRAADGACRDNRSHRIQHWDLPH